jgi:hypothetical protein
VVTVCDDACWYGGTLADGTVDVVIDALLPAHGYSLILHARPSRAGYYLPLPAVSGGLVRFPDPLVLPAFGAGGPAVLTDGAAQVLADGDVTLELAAGVGIHPDFEDISVGGPILFRARSVPRAAWPPFVRGAGALAALYAVAPYEAVIDPPGATLRLRNSAALPAGSAVDLLALGSLVWPGGPEPGTLVPIASAHVTADGTEVLLDGDARILFVTWFALRPRGP